VDLVFARLYEHRERGIIAAVPATFYATSLIRKNSYDQGTALLAGEAVVDDTVLMVVIKSVTQRLRPTDVAASGKLFRHLFPKQQIPDRQGHQLSVGARADELFRGYGVSTALPPGSMDSLRRIRSGGRA
jgi:hypothetical protein